MKKSFLVIISLWLVFFNINLVADPSVQEKEFFTENQEAYLADHPYVLAYFIALYSQKETPEAIASEHQLSPQVNQKYLKVLSDIKVITPHSDPKSVPRFLVQGVMSFAAGGSLAKKLTDIQYRQYYEQTLLDTKKDNQKNIVLAPGLWLTEKEYEDYKKETLALEEKYINLSVQNRQAKSPNAFRVSALINIIPKWEPSIFTDIKKNF